MSAFVPTPGTATLRGAALLQRGPAPIHRSSGPAGQTQHVHRSAAGVAALGLGIVAVSRGRGLRALAGRKEERVVLRGAPAWDPLGLTQDEDSFRRAKILEKILGRVAMLAVVGVPAAELWHEEIAAAAGLPNLLTETGQAPTLMNGGMFSPVAEVVVVSGLVGLTALAYEAGADRAKNSKEVDTLRGAPTLSPMIKSMLGEAQIFNGRVAMVAIMAIAVQEIATGQATVDITPFLFNR